MVTKAQREELKGLLDKMDSMGQEERLDSFQEILGEALTILQSPEENGQESEGNKDPNFFRMCGLLVQEEKAGQVFYGLKSGQYRVPLAVPDKCITDVKMNVNTPCGIDGYIRVYNRTPVFEMTRIYI